MARVCARPGCPAIAIDGRHCEDHAGQFPRQRDPEAARQYDRDRGNRHKRGYGSKWAASAKAYLAKHKQCVECGDTATDVDHINPWRQAGKPDWQAFWDRRNWQALCHSCHSRKTWAANRGHRQGEGGAS